MKAAALRRAWLTGPPRRRVSVLPSTACQIGPQFVVGLDQATYCCTGRSSFTRRRPGIEDRGSRRGRRDLSFEGHEDSTIYALSSAPGRAAIAIIRLSGPECLHVYRLLCPGTEVPKPRHASLRTLYTPGASPTVDSLLDSNALVLYFPAPRTVTGEDVLELHVHGGTATVKAVLAAISSCNSNGPRTIRYAEPGEFTRRAFTNDRLDLTQVEALGDILSATTEQQRRVSVRGATNALAKTYERWRQQLLYARGELEALIDFSEDQHFDESPAQLCASVSAQVRVLQRLVQAHVQNSMKGELLRHGIIIALLGAPNAGKSSLLNHIVGREAAIVSHEEGTTRDVIEVGIDLGGFFCRLGDTAGLRRNLSDRTVNPPTRPTISAIEEEGMRRSKQRAAESDVVIVVLSFETRNDVAELATDAEVMSTAAELIRTKDNVLVAINKSDLISDPASLSAAIDATVEALPGISHDRIHPISCHDTRIPTINHEQEPFQPDPGRIQAFLHALIQYFTSLTTAVRPNTGAGGTDSAGDPSAWQDSLGASERHRLLLLQCAGCLDDFQAMAAIPDTCLSNEGSSSEELDLVVAAEHLRSAADCLTKITGKGEAGDVEEVLGVVFEKFCVGK